MKQGAGISIPADGGPLQGSMALPRAATGIVAFAHGSGSSRFSPRNVYVARALQQAGVGTLLFDLLTREEDHVYQTRFDIGLLTERLLAASRWLKENPDTAAMKLGYFGASTGAAAALQAAAEPDAGVAAVVSRGGRPDLAGNMALGKVQCPTLLIVGGLDDVVIGLNRQAHARLQCPKELVIVPGASHLFEEPGTLERVAELAAAWFVKHLA